MNSKKIFLHIGIYFFLSLLFLIYPDSKPDRDFSSTNVTVYAQIRSAIKDENYTLAEELIQSEMNTRYGDPELEYYQVDLWLRRANELYEKEQFKSALEYYLRVYKSWPNHPTVRERIERWKGKRPFNKQKVGQNIQTKEPEDQESGVSIRVFGLNESQIYELFLLKDSIKRNNEQVDQFFLALYFLMGVLVTICLLLIAIFIKLISKSEMNQKTVKSIRINAEGQA
jgi:hypothetical protein